MECKWLSPHLRNLINYCWVPPSFPAFSRNIKDWHIDLLKSYICYNKNQLYQNVANGGVITYVYHIYYSEEIPLNTNLQALAMKVLVFQQYDLEEIVHQLPPPFLIVGDFIAHNIIWRSKKTHLRGKIIEQFLLDPNIFLLNDGQSTHLHFSSIYWTVSYRPQYMFYRSKYNSLMGIT